MSHSNLEHVVKISPSAASTSIEQTKTYQLSSPRVRNRQGYLRVFPVSRHATFAHVSWLSTSHFNKLRMTLLRWVNVVCFHSLWARVALLIFSSISCSASARKVPICKPVEGSNAVMYRRPGMSRPGRRERSSRWDSRCALGI